MKIHHFLTSRLLPENKFLIKGKSMESWKNIGKPNFWSREKWIIISNLMQSNSDEGCYNLHGEALTNKICAPDHSSLLLSFIHYLPRLYFFVSVMRCTIFCFPFFSSSVSHFYCLSLKCKPHFVFYWKETFNCGKKERYMLSMQRTWRTFHPFVKWPWKNVSNKILGDIQLFHNKYI